MISDFILLQDPIIDGQWFPEAEVTAKYKIILAERGLRTKMGQQITPDYPETVEVLKVFFNGKEVQLHKEDISFIEKILEE